MKKRHAFAGRRSGLARTHQLTVYGAIYLDLAARRGIALATHDQELRRAQ